jgi:hypothetical protein
VQLVAGVLYPCTHLKRLIELNVLPSLPNEVIDLFDEKCTNEEVREKIAALYSVDVLSACAYCNGLCDDSVRYTPAEQLTAAEVRVMRN